MHYTLAARWRAPVIKLSGCTNMFIVDHKPHYNVQEYKEWQPGLSKMIMASFIVLQLCWQDLEWPRKTMGNKSNYLANILGILYNQHTVQLTCKVTVACEHKSFTHKYKSF